MKRFIAVLLLALACGCEAEKKLADARNYYFEQAVPKYEQVQDSFFDLADKMVKGRFQERRSVLKSQMSNWWREHTADISEVTVPYAAEGEEAPLTSMPSDYVPTGVVFEWNKNRNKRFPIRAEAMQAQMEAYANAMAQCNKDEAIWDELCREYKAIRDPFRKVTSSQANLEKDAADTQRRMEEFSQHVMSTAVGVGVGIGIGAATGL